MNYIINPSFFYLADICKTVKILSVILSVASFLVLIFVAIAKYNEYLYQENYKIPKKWIKMASIILAICLVLLLFVPRETTLYKMQLSKLSTVENIDKTFKYIDKAVDKILKQK